MLYREIIAVCSDILTESINTLCEQIMEFFYVKPGGTYGNHRTSECYLYSVILYIYIYTVAQKERMFLKWIYLPAISFFGVTSNQMSTFENLVQSTI